jgi:O-acetyl-ADP-ribose deacetylase
MNQGDQFGGYGLNGARAPGRTMALLRQATGLDVAPDRGYPAGAELMVDAAIGTKSVQRIVLQQRGEGLVLMTCPAELKPQAKALYRTGRAGQLTDFLARSGDVWQADANPHLAFFHARPAQRLYLSCRLPVAEYVRRWSGGDFAQVREHRHDEIRQGLWPWLLERQYAVPEDDLDVFLGRLGRRSAHLRPGIKMQRIWPWAHAEEADNRGMLASEVRTAIIELLTALGEPLPP